MENYTTRQLTTHLTEGNILGQIARFALPILAGNLLQELYNFVDTFIVGKMLGATKLAAVGATGPLFFLVFGFILGLTSGCAVVTSQYYGAENEAALKKSVAAHLMIASGFTLALSLIFAPGTRLLLEWLHTTPDTLEDARIYLTIIYSGISTTMFYNFLAASLRAIGNSRTPLMFLVFSSLLNIALDITFILVFQWDVAGVAAATVAAQLVSGILCFLYVQRRVPLLIPNRESWTKIGTVIAEELKVGVPLGIQFSVIALGLMVLQSVLNGFGSDAVAGFTVGARIQGLMQNPIASMCVVMATFTAQNAGAGNFKRIRTGVKKCLWITLGFSSLTGLGVWLFAEQAILCVVKPDELAVIAYAKQYLAWSCPWLWTLSFLFICRGALQGLGDGITPLIGAMLELILRAVLPLFLSGYLAFTSVCIAGPCAWTSCGVLMWMVYLCKIRRKTRDILPQSSETGISER